MVDAYDATTDEVIALLDYQTSADVNEIFGALAKAQGEIKNAAKDSVNPGFKSKYADLASIADACRVPLSKNGIAVIQIPHNDGENIAVSTILGHSSGQWMRGKLAVKPAKWDAQGAGSVITYLRRYSLAAMAGVAPGDDDDGEAAAGRGDGTNRAEVSAPSSAGNRPSGTRTASPRTVETDPVRVAATEIKNAIDHSPHLTGLNALMSTAGVQSDSTDPKEGSKLAAIAAGSPETYHWLLDRAQKKRGQFLNAPAQAAE